VIMEEAGDVCVSKTELYRLGCPLLVDGSVCIGGGPLIKLFVIGCLWCVAERGCGAGVVSKGKSLLGLGVCEIWRHLFGSQCVNVCV
jgi:hypothetical protein